MFPLLVFKFSFQLRLLRKQPHPLEMHVKMPILVVYIYSDAVAQTEHKKDLFFFSKKESKIFDGPYI